MNIMKKIKEGPTVTMFVPYDCNNSCPFCVNKEEYRKSSSFDLDRCYRSLDLLDRIFPHNDVVFTGGEPLAELEALEDIWNEYQVYESDEINYIDDSIKMRYGNIGDTEFNE